MHSWWPQDRRAAETGAALMNCGLAPTMLSIFVGMRFPVREELMVQKWRAISCPFDIIFLASRRTTVNATVERKRGPGTTRAYDRPGGHLVAYFQ